MKDLISIIIPVYKVEEYLCRCIESILHQTYSNLEIILVDDGSPDSCGDICDNYASIDSRVKVIHKNNGGLSDARNVGIEIASGAFITFLDSDDWVHIRYVETLYKLIKSKHADISICNYIKATPENFEKIYEGIDNIESVDNIENIIIYEFSNIDALNQLAGELYLKMVVTWGKLYKAELFKEIRFPVGKIHEDEFTTYKLLFRANNITFTTEVLLYYWHRTDSITGGGFKIKNKLNLIEALEERAEFYYKLNQAKLVGKTYRTLFAVYKSVNDNICLFLDEPSKNSYYHSYKIFKHKLRNSQQSFAFKIYYELYFIFPKLSQVFKSFYKLIRG